MPEAGRVPEVLDCLVLSGGGAKGAYGAGVAKALYQYRELKRIETTLCFIGASAGALNAAVLAAEGPDKLIELWQSATNRSVLGVRIRNTRFQAAKRWLSRTRPFALYPNGALKQWIQSSVSYDAIKDKHMFIAATDYTRGRLRAFYVSSLADRFLDADVTRPVAERRLTHWCRIESQDELVEILLASAAIPIFFPPVKIRARVRVENGSLVEEGWHIDGGIGNHTPTREAAYFLRHLEKQGLGKAGEVYCVKQDPPRVIAEETDRFGATEILKRTLDVYHYVHMEPIIGAWFRINDEVKRHSQKVDAFSDWLAGVAIADEERRQIRERLIAELGRLGGATSRGEFEMAVVEPGSSLGDSLDFNQAAIRTNITRGYQEALGSLRAAGKINAAEYQDLVNRPVFLGGN